MEKKVKKDAMLTSRVPKTLKEAAKVRAKELSTGLSDLVRIALEKFLKK